MKSITHNENLRSRKIYYFIENDAPNLRMLFGKLEK